MIIMKTSHATKLQTRREIINLNISQLDKIYIFSIKMAEVKSPSIHKKRKITNHNIAQWIYKIYIIIPKS